LQLLFLHHDKEVVADFISPTLVMGFDYLAGDWIDQLATQSVARAAG
jgi:hypothetical protein